MIKSFLKKIIFSIFGLSFLGAIVFFIGTHKEMKSIHFGSMQDSISSKRKKHSCCQQINREGLDSLNAYGSGFINFSDLNDYYTSQITPKGSKLYVVNLLPDHLYYYNNRCLRWYGLGYFPHDLGKQLFKQNTLKLFYKKLIRFTYGNPLQQNNHHLKTEQNLVESMGGVYHLPLKGAPEWLNNDEFVENTLAFFESLPENAHLYVHCAHGRGRTTSYLVLYDIFKNAKYVPLKDITNRHYCLGREDVLDTKLWSTGTWTQEALDARAELVTQFYEYMTDPLGYQHTSWTLWKKNKYYTSSQKITEVHR